MDLGTEATAGVSSPVSAKAITLLEWWPCPYLEPAQMATGWGVLFFLAYICKARSAATLKVGLSVLVSGAGVFFGAASLVLAVTSRAIPADFRVFFGAGGGAIAWVGIAEFWGAFHGRKAVKQKKAAAKESGAKV